MLSVALGWTVAPSASAASPAPAASLAPATGEVYGFLPYWSIDGGIDDYLAGAELSTIGLFSVGATASGDLDTSAPGYRAITGAHGRRIVADAHAAGRRVELVFTSFGTEANAAFFGDPARQATTVEALGALVETLGLDGLDLDVEGLDPTWIAAYGSFVGAVRARLSAIDPALTLSVATTANFAGALMAGAAIARGAGHVFVMGYDYHWAGSTAAGPSSPLDSSDPGDRTLRQTLDLYALFGVPPDRTILGLPLYGVSWPVLTHVRRRSDVTGTGAIWLPSTHAADRRVVTRGSRYDPVASVEVYQESTGPGTARRLYYDSARSLRPKIALVGERGLAGVGFWALGYDRGWPGLWDVVRSLVRIPVAP